MKYGFLFGAGAETAYKLPLGGKFALDIFRQDTTEPKEKFKKMREAVELTTAYANQWLPKDYKNKNVNVFGKSVFQNIILSTVEHRREQIVEIVNDFDEVANRVVANMEADGIEVDSAFEDLLNKKVSNIQFGQNIAYNKAFEKGDKLFESNYFSSLLMVYRDRDEKGKQILGRILLSIMQLQMGALSEELSRSINDNPFSKKDEQIDIFDDFGELIKLNYNATGVMGLELLLENPEIDTTPSYDIVLKFAKMLMEDIYASVLDYKGLIDANWHYLYNPSSDWAKFCKITIFLFTVREYIMKLGNKADKNNPNGYYNMLREALDNGRFEASIAATTNYNTIIEEILGNKCPITYLNGSVELWYDPYLNKVGTETELNSIEKHIIVPLLFTQSGTKPMTSIGMSMKYVETYNQWRKSDSIVVVGFGFGTDDEHINGIIRTLVNDDGKNIKVVKLNQGKTRETEAQEISRKLKVFDHKRIQVILVDQYGNQNGIPWTECLE